MTAARDPRRRGPGRFLTQARHGRRPVAPTSENSLDAWEDKTAAVAERITQALLDAVRAAKPAAQRLILEPAMIASEEELDAYLDEVRAGALKIIRDGRPVVLP